MTRLLFLLMIFPMVTGLAPGAHPTARPEARAQTGEVPSDGDAADDPAIWVHPADSAKSLILGTDKLGGLIVYDLDGRQRQIASPGCMPDNVDVLPGFELDGRKVDLAVASTRAPAQMGIKVWRIDLEARKLVDLSPGRAIPIFGGKEPYGCCGYRSRKSGLHYVFVTSKTGEVEQHLLSEQRGRIALTLVRTLKVGGVVEGCVADHEMGHLYIAEEGVGVWKYSAEEGVKRTLVARVGDFEISADVEGLTIYYGAEGKGYLIASSQGNNTFKVFERDGNNRFVMTIDPKDGKIDDVTDTDGIDVTHLAMGERFPRGFLIVQDGSNRGGRQNFKMYGWEDIAGHLPLR